jgi:hypothetical protein
LNGQLGNGVTSGNQNTPQTVLAVSGATDVAVGYRHACAVVAAGAVKCWGENGKRQLGDNTTITRATAVNVTGLTGADELALGIEFSCARTGATASCWGTNSRGALGAGMPASTWTGAMVETVAGTPVAVKGSGFVRLGALGARICGVVTSGGTSCWGGNSVTGDLGNALIADQTTPAPVTGLPVTVPPPVDPPPVADPAVAVEAFSGTTCVRTTGAKVRCWGQSPTAAR